MSLVPLAMLVIAAFGGIVAVSIAMLSKPLVRLSSVIEPAQRARWLMAFLAAPWLAGIVTVAAAWVPCLFEPRGVTEREADATCQFCLFHPEPVTRVVWILGLLAAIPFVRALIAGTRGLNATRHVANALQPIARLDARVRVKWIPGIQSFAAGWPRTEAWIGEGLVSVLTPTALDAVIAHERAHVIRRDVNTRVLARMLAAGHFPMVSQSLVAALDLAIEQACDVDASRAVRDPLVVADALVAVSRLGDLTLSAAPAFGESAIETRVDALCNARWASRARTSGLAMAMTSAMALGGIAMSARLHHAAEAWVALITR